MKKLIITTLMAATCSAFAADPVEYTAIIGTSGSNQSITSGNNVISWKTGDTVSTDTFDSWAITFTVDQLTLTGTDYKPTISCATAANDASKAAGLAIAVKKDGQGCVLALANPSAAISAETLTFTSGQEYFFAYDSNTSTAYAGIVGGGSVDNMISCVVSDDSLVTSFTSGTSRAFTSTATVRMSMGNGYDMAALSETEFSNVMSNLVISGVVSTAAPAVPEPATATLSLLALAGLCARRRRK